VAAWAATAEPRSAAAARSVRSIRESTLYNPHSARAGTECPEFPSLPQARPAAAPGARRKPWRDGRVNEALRQDWGGSAVSRRPRMRAPPPGPGLRRPPLPGRHPPHPPEGFREHLGRGAGQRRRDVRNREVRELPKRERRGGADLVAQVVEDETVRLEPPAERARMDRHLPRDRLHRRPADEQELAQRAADADARPGLFRPPRRRHPGADVPLGAPDPA
jgi:hypothetical protein